MIQAIQEIFSMAILLISVGLDWDWEDQRIDKIMYDLKTKEE